MRIKGKLSFNHLFWLLFFINFLMMMVNNLQGIMPSHLRALGSSDTLIALYSNLPNILLIVFVLITTGISVRRYRLFLVRSGFIVAAIAALGSWYFANNLLLLIVLRVFFALAFALEFSLLFGLMYDQVGEKQRRSGASIFGISGLLTASPGNWISEAFFKSSSVSALLLLITLPALLGLILSFFLQDKVADETEPQGANTLRIPFPQLFPLILLSLAFGGAFGGFYTYLSRVTETIFGLPEIASFWTAFTITSIILRLVLNPVIDKTPRRLLLLLSFGCSLLAYTLYPGLSALWQVIVLGALYGITHSLLFPTLSASFVDLAPEQKNQANNLFLGLFTGGQILFSFIMGMISDNIDLLLAPWFMVGIMILGIVISTFWGRTSPQKPIIRPALDRKVD
jgi:MFS family permease